jgi:hypothetical protein
VVSLRRHEDISSTLDLTRALRVWLQTARIGDIAKKRFGPVTITSLCARIENLANSHAEPQIAAGREPQTMGLNLWSNVTL